LKRAWRIIALVLTLVGALAGALHGRVSYLVSQPRQSSVSQAVQVADQRYFAYGSNMSTRYLGNVRGVWPSHGVAAELAGYEVVFLGPGLNGLEPAFAYLRAHEGAVAHGVLHRLTQADLDRIKASEGASYEWASLPVKLADGSKLAAHTLVRTSPGMAGTPSRRYLSIMREGASEHGLPKPYLDKLRAQPSLHVPVVSEVVGSALMMTVMQRAGTCNAWLVC
jgi:AIG2-like family